MKHVRIEQRWCPLPWAAMVAVGLSSLARSAPAASGSWGANGPSQGTDGSRESAGRPTVKLNRLTFPSIPEGSYYKNYLARSLQRETGQADWGAGKGSVIEYRFRVDRLEVETEPGLIRVHCAATGELPAGKNAASRLAFSGDPAQRRQLIEKVLAIVARGVVTRLAQIEHARRKKAHSGASK